MSSEIHPGPVTQPEDCAGGCWDTAAVLTSHCRLCRCKDNVCQTFWARVLRVMQIGDRNKQLVFNGLKEIISKHRVSSSPLWSRIKQLLDDRPWNVFSLEGNTFYLWKFPDCLLVHLWTVVSTTGCHEERTLLSVGLHAEHVGVPHVYLCDLMQGWGIQITSLVILFIII